MADKLRAEWWWIDRWRKSTAYTDMTLAEQGAYRNLIDELWLRGGVIPDEERTLAKACGDAIEWKKVKKAVMAHFYLTPEGWRNETHDQVSAFEQELHDRQSDKGKKGAEKRWGKKDGQTDSQGNGQTDGRSDGQTDSQSNGQSHGRSDGQTDSQSNGQTMSYRTPKPYSETETETGDRGPPCSPPHTTTTTVWEECTGNEITLGIREELRKLEDEFAPETVIEAIRESAATATRGTINPRYVRRKLEAWQRYGRGNGNGPPGEGQPEYLWFACETCGNERALFGGDEAEKYRRKGEFTGRCLHCKQEKRFIFRPKNGEKTDDFSGEKQGGFSSKT